MAKESGTKLKTVEEMMSSPVVTAAPSDSIAAAGQPCAARR